jgi:hypothetical protein
MHEVYSHQAPCMLLHMQAGTQSPPAHVGADCITPWILKDRFRTNMLPLWRYVDGLDFVSYVCTNCSAYA